VGDTASPPCVKVTARASYASKVQRVWVEMRSSPQFAMACCMMDEWLERGERVMRGERGNADARDAQQSRHHVGRGSGPRYEDLVA
jgi:hypothetical protein